MATEPFAFDSGHTLDSLRRELKVIDLDLESGRQRERDLLYDLDKTGQKLVILESLVRGEQERLRLLQDSVQTLTAAVEVQERELARLGAETLDHEDAQRRLAQSLARTLLIDRRMSRYGALELMLGSSTWRELLQRRSVILRLRGAVVASLRGLAATVHALHSVEDAVFRQAQSLRDARGELLERRRAAAAVENSCRLDLTAVEQQKRILQQRLRQLRGSRELLTARRREVTAAQNHIEELIERFARGEPLTGVSLSLLKGSLPWPVTGRVVGKFGLQRNRKLATVTDNPGIDIAASENSVVRCIAEGLVSSVSWLRGFGNVCIVEHPGAFYSVYARLGQVQVKAGDALQMGALIGYPGYDGAAEDYRVHFELWAGKEKQNPTEWLKPE